jgi:hypothetical protein
MKTLLAASGFRNRLVFIVVPVAIAVLAGGYMLARHEAKKMDVRKFTGTIKSMDGDTIILRGAFYPLPSLVPEKFQGERDLVFHVDESTRFHGVLTSVPDLGNATGTFTFKPNELPKKEGPGSLQELRSLSGKGITRLEVTFPYSILQRPDPVAELVIYRHLPYFFQPPRATTTTSQ